MSSGSLLSVKFSIRLMKIFGIPSIDDSSSSSWDGVTRNSFKIPPNLSLCWKFDYKVFDYLVVGQL